MTDTSGDEIEICQNVEPHEDEDSVKSKAVVKFEAVQVPARFTKLQCNTDLNLPPSNWLSNSANSYGIQQSIYHSAGFASFRLANMFSDCLGEVDVVSDAENIKKLLKLPYSPKGAISMMIHRVENTLLIDEFDIQKYLLRQADDDWQWLRTFIFENILSSLGEKDRNFCIKDKSRGALQQKNLLSKFLYHSLLANESKTPESPEESQSTGNGKSIRHKTLLAGPILPEANIEENVPDPNSNHVFNRNVVWTFEDIRMLIGTDMPIFGGGTRPCISLRLRNMAEPINVLTGIDYWLDNLMCNVPEVVMCYHLDGIVQRYELIKTEDLPYLEDSKFSPQVIRNVAQNILSFLKANATKAGHTYWLFKGKNDDVVKLYDLTTLCKKGEGQSKNENPFTVPVAMLLYTVARNMKNSTTKISARKAGSIKTLLDNCIKLLPKEKYPQIVTSSHYILSDLQVPAGIDPKSPKFNEDLDSDSQSVYDDDYNSSECSSPEREEPDEYLDNKDNVAVKSICDTLKEFTLEDNWKNNRSPSPLIGAVEERCLEALQHIYEGIDCLQYFASNEEELQKEKVEMEMEQQKKKIIHEEQHPNMARPFQPIPLPYASLRSEPKLADPNTPIPLKWEGDEEGASSSSSCTKSKQKTKFKKSKKGDLQTIDENYNNLDQKIIPQDSSKLSKSWDIHLKLLLLEKACLTYATLAEHNYGLENYGISLRQIYAAIKCQKIVGHYMTTISSQRNCLLGRAGDCFFQMTKTWDNIDVCLEQFENFEKIDKSILAEIEKDINRDLQEELPVPGKNLELMMLSSCKCYEIALQASDEQTSRPEIIRRLGNVRNELGVKYMHWAQEEYTKFMETETTQETSAEDKKPDEVETDPVYQTLAKKSFDSLIKGIAAFEEVKDDINLYFLLCNMGRFMRFRAHIHLKGEQTFDVRRQKRFYVEAFSYYQRALSILGSRKKNPELWDLANWELSTASFTLAKQVQDFSDSEQIELEVEHETVELLQKSLKYCDVEHPGSRQVLYTFRSGLIHHRLASFYHSQLRKSHDDSKKKTNLQLCRMHYEKGAAILESLNESKDFLRVQIERIALQEFLAEGSNNTQKIKNLQIALDIFIQSKSILSHIIDSEVETDRFVELLKLFESRLQFVLRTLAKTCSMKTGTKDSNKMGDLYKKMYSATLKVCNTSDERNYAKHLSAILDTIMDLNPK